MNRKADAERFRSELESICEEYGFGLQEEDDGGMFVCKKDLIKYPHDVRIFWADDWDRTNDD